MGKTHKRLSAREKSFCCFFAAGGDTEDAARLAGYDRPELSGAALIAREEIAREIESLRQGAALIARQRAAAGYERLAFGKVTDAVSLLFAESMTKEELEALDLFQVAEIRRPKEGALEIKFFDRMKALERLEELGVEKSNGVSDFYAALVAGSAREARGPGEEEAP